MSSFGEMVRTHREKKGITLNEFAARLGVSPGYLSNLETGKTQNVKLHVLEKLQKELFVSPTLGFDERDHTDIRLNRVTLLYQECQEKNPSFTEHFLLQFEQSLDLIREG